MSPPTAALTAAAMRSSCLVFGLVALCLGHPLHPFTSPPEENTAAWQELPDTADSPDTTKASPDAAASPEPLHATGNTKCDPEDESAMRCWATKMMARKMPAPFLCNVSEFVTGQPQHHPALDFRNLKDFVLPADTHLFLYGTSHLRSVRQVLISAAELHNVQVNTTLRSMSDNCDEHKYGFVGSAASNLRRRNRGGRDWCGLFGEKIEDAADLIEDSFIAPDGSTSKITTVVNHRQYLVPEHSKMLEELLSTAEPKFTHGYFTFPHDVPYFDAHCASDSGGPKPNPSKVGDEVEQFCKHATPSCVQSSHIFRVIEEHIPEIGFRGGVAFKHAFGVNSSSSRIHDSYAEHLKPRFGNGKGLEHLAASSAVHACNAICMLSPDGRLHDRTDPYSDVHCKPGEGVAIAWEVLRSAGLVSCPKHGPECDSVASASIIKSWRRDDAASSPPVHKAASPSGSPKKSGDEYGADGSGVLSFDPNDPNIPVREKDETEVREKEVREAVYTGPPVDKMRGSGPHRHFSA